MGQDDGEVRKVDRDVLDQHRVGEPVAGAGEHGRPRVKDHWQTVAGARLVQFAEPRETSVDIAVGPEQLVRRVELDRPDPPAFCQARHLLCRVRVVGPDTSHRDQPVGVRLAVPAHEFVGFLGVADDLGRDVVDQERTLDLGGVEILQERPRLSEITPMGLVGVGKDPDGVRVHLPHWVNMDVAVRDAHRADSPEAPI